MPTQPRAQVDEQGEAGCMALREAEFVEALDWTPARPLTVSSRWAKSGTPSSDGTSGNGISGITSAVVT